MFDPSKAIKKMLGPGIKTPKFGKPTSADLDGDGISNIMDCQPKNMFRQDKIKPLEKTYYNNLPPGCGYCLEPFEWDKNVYIYKEASDCVWIYCSKKCLLKDHEYRPDFDKSKIIIRLFKKPKEFGGR